MTKVVINYCYGGFGLSSDAMKRLISAGCDAIIVYDERDYCGSQYPISKDGFIDVGDGYTADPMMSDVLYKDGRVYTYNRDVRDDPDLIRIVQEMGDDASGRLAELRVVDVPDGVKYTIGGYDGVEWVSEDHEVWM